MGKTFKTAATACVMASTALAAPAQAGTDAYIGEIMMTAASFCPRGTAELNGQLLAISSNQALFSLIGTVYGGNGTTTFGLPDLRGRVPMHYGSGNGLTPYQMGQTGGAEQVTLNQQEMPSHTHTATVHVSRADANTRAAVNANFARAAGVTYEDATPPAADTMVPNTVTNAPAGGSQPHENRQPFLTFRYCIYTVGIFPSRN